MARFRRIIAATVLLLMAISIRVGLTDEVNSGWAGDMWAYRTDATGVRPVARSFSMTKDRPQNFIEELSYRGSLRRYTQLRYGSENSRRVVIVVDELGDGEFDFYVDADRDRHISGHDILAGTGRSRTCDLAAEIVREDQAQQFARRVSLRLGVTQTRLGVATLGCIEGQVAVGEGQAANQDFLTRRIDGNANGLFADARDRILLDLNDDGHWDRVSEQFAFLPVLTIGGQRFAVRSDRAGNRFSLERIDGVGSLSVAVADLPESARIVSFEAMAFSDDGSAYALRKPNDPLAVPAGRYTLGSVTMTIDTGEREPWHFVFSRGGSVKAQHWIEIVANRQVKLEAVGRTRFELKANGTVRPGDALTVHPRLYTQHGLLVNLSCRGRQMGSFASDRFHNPCDIKLKSQDGDTLGAARSGFS